MPSSPNFHPPLPSEPPGRARPPCSPRTPRRVLIIDHDARRAGALARELGVRLSCLPVIRAVATRAGSHELIVLAAPHSVDRAELLRTLPDAPVIVVTDVADDVEATEWILAGADDVIPFPGAAPGVLGDSAVRVLARARRHAAAPHSETTAFTIGALPKSKKGRVSSLVAFLQAAALTDSLTGLANRRALDARLERLFAESMKDGSDLSVLILDIDDFKRANDVFGHAKGDELLVVLAGVLRSHCRKADLAGRFGGDELVVLLPRAAAGQAYAVAERIRQEFTARARLATCRSEEDAPLGIGLSIGVASRNSSGSLSAGELLQFADQALYAAKRSGKGCTRMFGARIANLAAAV